MVQFYFKLLLLWLNEQDLASFENRLVCLCRNCQVAPSAWGPVIYADYYFYISIHICIWTYLHVVMKFYMKDSFDHMYEFSQETVRT